MASSLSTEYGAGNLVGDVIGRPNTFSFHNPKTLSRRGWKRLRTASHVYPSENRPQTFTISVYPRYSLIETAVKSCHSGAGFLRKNQSMCRILMGPGDVVRKMGTVRRYPRGLWE